MKLLQYFTVAWLCIIVSLSANSQNLDFEWIDNNNNTIQLNSNHISGDFGRRECCVNKWHDGLDISGASGDNDEGYKLLSIEDGRIIKIEGDGNYHFIAIAGEHNFGYGHIFPWNSDHSGGGNFHLYRWDNLETYVIINIEDNIAYTSLTPPSPLPQNDPDNEYTFTFTYNGVAHTFSFLPGTGTLTNRVEAGAAIAPMGDSGGDGTSDLFDVHVHLYSFADLNTIDNAHYLRRWSNLKDPFQYLDHQEPDYHISIEEVKTDGEYFINPSFRLRVDMTHEFAGNDWQNGGNGQYNANEPIADFNAMALFIKKSTASDGEYELIRGAYFESYISDGSVESGLYSQRYPAHGSPNNTDEGEPGLAGSNYDWPNPSGIDVAHNKRDYEEDLDKTAGFGHARKTGIVGYAYTGGSNYGWIHHNYDPNPTPAPWDDYFFNDFPTRINWYDNFGREDIDIATEISEARYPDGIYHLTARGYNVYGEEFEDVNIPTNLIIDNFRPYIRNVLIRAGNESGTEIYSASWNYDGNSLSPSATEWNEVAEGDDIWIRVGSSEPLDADAIGLKIEDIHTSFISPEYSSTDNMEFHFTIPALGEELTQDLQLVIKGEDSNGNQLQTDPRVISIRQTETTWSPAPVSGEDRVHVFNTGATCNPASDGRTLTVTAGESCAYADIEADIRNPQVGQPVIFTAFTSGGADVLWDFSDDYTDDRDYAVDNVSGGEVTVIFWEDGSKNITLTVGDETFDFAGFVNVGATSPPLIISSITVNDRATASGNVGDSFQFAAVVSDYSGDVSYQWDFGNGASYSSASEASPSVTYYTPGSKNVRLTVYDDVGSVVATKNSMVNILNYPALQTEILSGCGEGGGQVTFDHFTSGGDGDIRNRTFYWDFGDGQYSTQERPTNYYDRPGRYDVTLIVCDNSGCAEYTSEGCIEVPDNGNADTDWHVLMYGNGESLPDDRLCPSNDGKDACNCVPEYPVGTPVVFNVDVQRGGGGYDEDYSYSWDFSAFSCTTSPHSASPDLAESSPGGHPYPQGPRTHVVTYDEPGYYVVKVSVQAENDSYSYWGTIKIVDGLGSPRCRTGFRDLSLSTTCWDAANPPTISYDYQFRNCPVDRVALYQEIAGSEILAIDDVSSGEELDFSWNGGTPEPINKLILKAYSGEYISGIKNYEVSIDLSEAPELTGSYNLCKGASTSIGISPVSGYAYFWTGDHPEYLSSTIDSNPVFTGMTEDSYVYTLNVTNNETGCISQSEVTIHVGSIGEANYRRTTRAGLSAFTLKAPFEGDNRSYQFEWSPATYLDNERSPNPVFTPPLVQADITYTVTATFRGCSSTSEVNITVRNDPPSNLQIEGSTKGAIHLSWTDNSKEKKFVVQRSEQGSDRWEILDELPSNTTRYTDAYCVNPEITYCYRVLAYMVTAVDKVIGSSETWETTCGNAVFALYPDWSIAEPKAFSNIGKGSLYERDDDIILATVFD